MKIIHNTVMDDKFIVVDNWYNSEELKSVWKELDFHAQTQELPRASENLTITGVDKTKSGYVSQAHCYRIYLDSFYTREKRNISPILNGTKKFINKDIHKKISKIRMGRQFPETNSDSTMTSYYEDGDHFVSHFDVFQFTVLIWLYKEPKGFEGGDLIFDDWGKKVEIKNNRMVLFPSYYLHRVDKIKMKTKDKFMGRYAITHFFYTVPTGAA